MNNQKFTPLLKAFVICSLLASASFLARADVLRTQTISLHKGWNAINLEVSPLNARPENVFSNTPVTIAAVHFGNESPVQYLQNPSAISWKKSGWAVWYGASRPDAFLTSLFAINGNLSYLIFAEQDFTWNVTGTVAVKRMQWQAESYNFAGFGVSPTAPPSFGKFFAGSAEHQPGKIYRLINDQWTLIANPSATAMRSGEACWIYCQGASDYQGPLTVKLTAGDAVSFGSTAEAPIAFENRTADPVNVKVETVAAGTAVPLGYVLRGVTVGKMAEATFDLPATYNLPALEGQQSSSLWLTLRREKMTADTQSALLKISTDSGAEIWVPVTGTLKP